MADPFQDVDAASDDFIQAFADSMDFRQSDPIMEQIVAAYLARLTFGPDTLTIEVGAGAGAVTRRIAAHSDPGQVIGYEPSAAFVQLARKRAGPQPNLRFEQADGAALPLPDDSADHVILHTVLTHVPHPEPLIQEARRILRPGGLLVVCDADFSKAALSNFPNDPLQACAHEFVRQFVTDPHVVAKLRPMILGAGLELLHFDVQSRVIADNDQMRDWVEEATKTMVARGDIGQPLADALVAEYTRRLHTGQIYGYQAFATAIARKA